MLLAIELLDELVGGTRAAAWPLIRRDLHLSYAQVGLVLAVPGFIGSALDPLVGALGDTRHRRTVLVWGGLAFALSAAASAGAIGYWTLLAALVVGNPGVGCVREPLAGDAHGRGAGRARAEHGALDTRRVVRLRRRTGAAHSSPSGSESVGVARSSRLR